MTTTAPQASWTAVAPSMLRLPRSVTAPAQTVIRPAAGPVDGKSSALKNPHRKSAHHGCEHAHRSRKTGRLGDTRLKGSAKSNTKAGKRAGGKILLEAFKPVLGISFSWVLVGRL